MKYTIIFILLINSCQAQREETQRVKENIIFKGIQPTFNKHKTFIYNNKVYYNINPDEDIVFNRRYDSIVFNKTGDTVIIYKNVLKYYTIHFDTGNPDTTWINRRLWDEHLKKFGYSSTLYKFENVQTIDLYLKRY